MLDEAERFRVTKAMGPALEESADKDDHVDHVRTEEAELLEISREILSFEHPMPGDGFYISSSEFIQLTNGFLEAESSQPSPRNTPDPSLKENVSNGTPQLVEMGKSLQGSMEQRGVEISHTHALPPPDDDIEFADEGGPMATQPATRPGRASADLMEQYLKNMYPLPASQLPWGKTGSTGDVRERMGEIHHQQHHTLIQQTHHSHVFQPTVALQSANRGDPRHPAGHAKAEQFFPPVQGALVGNFQMETRFTQEAVLRALGITQAHTPFFAALHGSSVLPLKSSMGAQLSTIPRYPPLLGSNNFPEQYSAIFSDQAHPPLPFGDLSTCAQLCLEEECATKKCLMCGKKTEELICSNHFFVLVCKSCIAWLNRNFTHNFKEVTLAHELKQMEKMKETEEMEFKKSSEQKQKPARNQGTRRKQASSEFDFSQVHPPKKTRAKTRKDAGSAPVALAAGSCGASMAVGVGGGRAASCRDAPNYWLEQLEKSCQADGIPTNAAQRSIESIVTFLRQSMGASSPYNIEKVEGDYKERLDGDLMTTCLGHAAWRCLMKNFAHQLTNAASPYPKLIVVSSFHSYIAAESPFSFYACRGQTGQVKMFNEMPKQGLIRGQWAPDVILIPVNVNNSHWVVAIYHATSHRLDYFGPLGGGISNEARGQITSALAAFDIDITSLISTSRDDFNHPNDDWNCGFLCCHIVERELRIIEERSDILTVRRRIVALLRTLHQAGQAILSATTATDADADTAVARVESRAEPVEQTFIVITDEFREYLLQIPVCKRVLEKFCAYQHNWGLCKNGWRKKVHDYDYVHLLEKVLAERRLSLNNILAKPLIPNFAGKKKTDDLVDVLLEHHVEANWICDKVNINLAKWDGDYENPISSSAYRISGLSGKSTKFINDISKSEMFTPKHFANLIREIFPWHFNNLSFNMELPYWSLITRDSLTPRAFVLYLFRVCCLTAEAVFPYEGMEGIFTSSSVFYCLNRSEPCEDLDKSGLDEPMRDLWNATKRWRDGGYDATDRVIAHHIYLYLEGKDKPGLDPQRLLHLSYGKYDIAWKSYWRRQSDKKQKSKSRVELFDILSLVQEASEKIIRAFGQTVNYLIESRSLSLAKELLTAINDHTKELKRVNMSISENADVKLALEKLTNAVNVSLNISSSPTIPPTPSEKSSSDDDVVYLESISPTLSPMPSDANQRKGHLLLKPHLPLPRPEGKIDIAKDGNCFFASVGYIVDMNQAEVREALSAKVFGMNFASYTVEGRALSYQIFSPNYNGKPDSIHLAEEKTLGAILFNGSDHFDVVSFGGDH